MVKKLIKHEFLAFSRTMLPMELILIGLAILTRGIQLFETDSTAYRILNGSAIVMFCISIVVCLVMTFVVSIVRFYKNLFTHEGYLSFTLPVSPTQHIFSKLIVAVCFYVITFLVVVLSCAVATMGDVFAEIVKAFAYIFEEYFSFFGANGALYLLEVIIFVLVFLASGLLNIYACISVGQLAKKNRILAAFGAYFAYYIFCQLVATVFIIICTCVDLPFDFIFRFAANHPYAATHTFIWVGILFYALLGTAYFFVSHALIRKKLNLE